MNRCPVCDAEEPYWKCEERITRWKLCVICALRLVNNGLGIHYTFSQLLRAIADEQDRVQLARRAETEPYPPKL